MFAIFKCDHSCHSFVELNWNLWMFYTSRTPNLHKIKRFSTKFDDLGIIMREKMEYLARWKNKCWSEQSPKISTVPCVFFWGGHVIAKSANFEMNLLILIRTWQLFRDITMHFKRMTSLHGTVRIKKKSTWAHRNKIKTMGFISLLYRIL